MASFTPPVNPTNDPSYLGASQGTEKAGFQPLAALPSIQESRTPDYRSDSTYGKLAEGIGNILDVAATGADKAIKQHIRDDLDTKLASIRDRFGVAQAASDTGQPQALGAATAEGVAVPQAVNRLGNKLTGLRDLYNNGELNNSYYWATQESEVRKIKSQYPGYTDYVDQKVESILGTTPANALRKSLLEDVEALAKKQQTQADKWDTFVNTHTAVIHQAMPDYEARIAAGNPYPQLYVKQEVGRIMAEDHNFDQKIKRIAYGQAANKFIGDDAERTLTERFEVEGRRVFDAAANQATGDKEDFTSLYSRLNKQVAGGTPLTKDQQIQVRTMFNSIKLNMRNKFDDVANTVFDPADPKKRNFKTVINDPTKYTQMVDLGLERVKAFEEALYNPQSGLLPIFAATNNAQKDGDVMNVTNGPNGHYWRQARVANEMLGSQGVAALYASADGSFLSDMLIALRTMNVNNAVTGQPAAAQKAFENGAQFKQGPEYYNKYIDDLSKVISLGNTAANSEAVKNAAQSIFNPNYNVLEKHIGPNDRPNVYARLVNEQTANGLYEIRDKHPEVWADYKRWAANNYVGIVNQKLGTIQNAVITDDRGKFNYDPKTNQFGFQWGDKYQGMFRKGWLWDTLSDTDYPSLVKDINVATNAFRSVLAKDNQNPEGLITQILQSRVNMNAEFKGGVIEQLLNAVKEKMQKTNDNSKTPPVQALEFTDAELPPSGVVDSSLGGFLSNPAGVVAPRVVAQGNNKKPTRNALEGADLNSIKVDDIPDGMSAKEFIRQLKQRGLYGNR